jgi:hypothetical protein
VQGSAPSDGCGTAPSCRSLSVNRLNIVSGCNSPAGADPAGDKKRDKPIAAPASSLDPDSTLQQTTGRGKIGALSRVEDRVKLTPPYPRVTLAARSC